MAGNPYTKLSIELAKPRLCHSSSHHGTIGADAPGMRLRYLDVREVGLARADDDT